MVENFEDEEFEEYDKIKRIIKELLFNGANRDSRVRNKKFKNSNIIG